MWLLIPCIFRNGWAWLCWEITPRRNLSSFDSQPGVGKSILIMAIGETVGSQNVYQLRTQQPGERFEFSATPATGALIPKAKFTASRFYNSPSRISIPLATCSESSKPFSTASAREQSCLCAYFCSANQVTGLRVISRFTVTLSCPSFSSTSSSSLDNRATDRRKVPLLVTVIERILSVANEIRHQQTGDKDEFFAGCSPVIHNPKSQTDHHRPIPVFC